MKMYTIVILLAFGLAQVTQAQGNYDVLLVPSESDTLTSDKELAEENKASSIKYVGTQNNKVNADD